MSKHAAAMLELLENPDSWMQDGYSCRTPWNDKVSYCLMGAHGKVAHGSPGFWAGKFITARNQTLTLLADVIKEQFPERTGHYVSPGPVIIAFNDNPDTTHDDVMCVMEKAVVRETEL